MAVNLYKPGAEPFDIPETCTVEETELSQMLSAGWMVATETPATTPETAELVAEEAVVEVSMPDTEAEQASAEEAPVE
jgi:hypothetical protein